MQCDIDDKYKLSGLKNTFQIFQKVDIFTII